MQRCLLTVHFYGVANDKMRVHHQDSVTLQVSVSKGLGGGRLKKHSLRFLPPHPPDSLDMSVCRGLKPQKADGTAGLGCAFLADEMMGLEVSAGLCISGGKTRRSVLHMEQGKCPVSVGSADEPSTSLFLLYQSQNT